MRIKKLLFCLLLATASTSAAFGSAPQSQAATLHMIMVADTEDFSIGDNVAIDMGHMRREAQRIANYADLKLDLTELSGEGEFNSAKVVTWMRDLEVNDDDVIFFYYTGHGYRNESKSSDWPVLFFEWANKNIDLGWVADQLALKNARFTLVMADCCNNIIDDASAPGYLKARAKSPKRSMEAVKKNYRRLYREFEGDLLIASSDVGEYSYCSEYVGSWFTSSWIEAVSDEVHKPGSAEWSVILLATYKDLEEYQHPIWELLAQ